MRKGIIFYCINAFFICFSHHSGIHYYALGINRISAQRRQVLRDNYGEHSLFVMIILRIFLFNQININLTIKQFRTSSLHKKKRQQLVTHCQLSEWIFLNKSGFISRAYSKLIPTKRCLLISIRITESLRLEKTSQIT